MLDLVKVLQGPTVRQTVQKWGECTICGEPGWKVGELHQKKTHKDLQLRREMITLGDFKRLLLVLPSSLG